MPVFFPGEFHAQRILVDYSPGGRKELDMTGQLTPTYFIFGQVSKVLLIILMLFFVCFAILQAISLNRLLVEYSQIGNWYQTGRKQYIYYKGFQVAL